MRAIAAADRAGELDAGELRALPSAARTERLVALRGDIPSGMGAARISHNAESLVRWVREHSGDHFHIEVAAYPEVHPDATSAESDL